MNRTKATSLRLSLARIGINPSGLSQQALRRAVRALRAHHRKQEQRRGKV